MATLGTSAYTLTDIAKTWDPDGKPARIVEMLSQTNEMLMDMLFVEGNLPTGHRTTVRTNLPTPTWRLINEGVTPTTTDTAQLDEQCGMLEDYSNVDKDLAELNGNVSGFRLQSAAGHIEGMNQEAASTLIYGNAGTAPEEFNGFAVRYNDLSANNGQNIIDGAGTGSDNASIWLVGWGALTCHGIYPKGSQAGLFHEDLGLQTVTVSTGISGSLLRAYQDHWQWKIGLAIPDWRSVVRIANIDISNLVAKSSAADLFDLMIKAINVIPNMNMVKPVFYMNRTVWQMLWIQGRDDVISGGGLTFDNVAGRPVRSFMGIPVRLMDALTETEAQIT